MIFIAPYKNFRHVDKTGLELRFPNGRREVYDKAEIAAIRRIPESKGLITDREGNVVNRAPKKRSAKRDKNRHQAARVQD